MTKLNLSDGAGSAMKTTAILAVATLVLGARAACVPQGYHWCFNGQVVDRTSSIICASPNATTTVFPDSTTGCAMQVRCHASLFMSSMRCIAGRAVHVFQRVPLVSSDRAFGARSSPRQPCFAATTTSGGIL
jgi:hypothetical protein